MHFCLRCWLTATPCSHTQQSHEPVVLYWWMAFGFMILDWFSLRSLFGSPKNGHSISDFRFRSLDSGWWISFCSAARLNECNLLCAVKCCTCFCGKKHARLADHVADHCITCHISFSFTGAPYWDIWLRRKWNAATWRCWVLTLTWAISAGCGGMQNADKLWMVVSGFAAKRNSYSTLKYCKNSSSQYFLSLIKTLALPVKPEEMYLLLTANEFPVLRRGLVGGLGNLWPARWAGSREGHSTSWSCFSSQLDSCTEITFYEEVGGTKNTWWPKCGPSFAKNWTTHVGFQWTGYWLHASVEMSDSETCLWCPHTGFSSGTWLDNLSKPDSLKAESGDVCQCLTWPHAPKHVHGPTKIRKRSCVPQIFLQP